MWHDPLIVAAVAILVVIYAAQHIAATIQAAGADIKRQLSDIAYSVESQSAATRTEISCIGSDVNEIRGGLADLSSQIDKVANPKYPA